MENANLFRESGPDKSKRVARRTCNPQGYPIVSQSTQQSERDCWNSYQRLLKLAQSLGQPCELHLSEKDAKLAPKLD